MKISMRLAWTIHSMQGAKNFDIFCCERGKSHIDARTGGDARTGPWLYIYIYTWNLDSGTTAWAVLQNARIHLLKFASVRRACVIRVVRMAVCRPVRSACLGDMHIPRPSNIVAVHFQLIVFKNSQSHRLRHHAQQLFRLPPLWPACPRFQSLFALFARQK